MRGNRITILALIILTAFAIYSCGGGGTSTTSGTSISGKVADGYVANAKVTVYSDADMTTQIGSGTSNSNGDFTITLSVSQLPATIYLKSEGGYAIDTGLPAPTMRFVGETSGLSSYNITPITELIFTEFLNEGNLQTALQNVASDLGLSINDLYSDPETNQNVSDAVEDVVSSATLGGTLPPGDYIGYAYVFDSGDLGNLTITDIASLTALRETFSITVDSNGNVTGQTSDSSSITGMVKGSSMVLEIEDSPTSLTRVAGEIGIMGCISGVFTSLDSSTNPPTLTNGVFLATVIPSTVSGSQTYIDGLRTSISGLLPGPHFFLGRDSFRTDITDDIELAWGSYTIDSISTDVLTISSGLDVRHEDAPDTSVNYQITSAALDVDNSQNPPIPTLMFEMEFTDDTANPTFKGYLIRSIGNRKGIYLITDPSTGTVTSIGDANFTPNVTSMPHLKENTTYDVESVSLDFTAIDLSRTNLINYIETNNYDRDQFTSPTYYAGMGPIGHTGDVQNGLTVLTGSIFGKKEDQDLDNMGDTADSITVGTLYATGAFSGEYFFGGTTGTTLNSDNPGLFVGFTLENTTNPTIPTFTGTLYYLERTVYTNDYSGYSGSYGMGTITISSCSGQAGEVSISHTDANGQTESISLACEKSSTAGGLGGIYHMYGSTTDGYLDVFWSVGSKKAIWFSSNDTAGNGTITDVGEAYLTY